MSYFDLDPRSDADALTWAIQNPAKMPGAGFFDGSLTAAPKGLWSGIVAKPALLFGDAGDVALKPIAKGIDNMFGGTTATDFLAEDRKKRINMVQATMPDARMGLAGQIMFGAGDVLPGAVVGTVLGGPAGGAAVVGSTQGYADKVMAQEKGVDELTALGQGTITGVTQAAGVLLPASVGGSVLKSVGVGVAGNVGIGVAQRAATGALLESRGYAELAKQYSAFDTEAMAVDAVLGAAFGVIGAKFHGEPGEAPRPRPEVPSEIVDSALAANAVQHVDTGIAPGIPVDPISQAAHTKAVNKAVGDLMADRSVDISGTGIENAGFVPVRSETRAAVNVALDELHPLRQALDEVDVLRDEVRALGLEPADEQLLTGRALPDEGGAAVVEAKPLSKLEAGRLKLAKQEAAVLAAEESLARRKQVADQSAAGAGRRAEVFVGDRPEPVRFAVVEADSLAPQIGKAENQYRDRSRVASELQITKIANNLQFGRLADAPSMAEGAPTIAKDGRIVGGNGRVAAVRQAYEQGGAADYREQLTARAQEFGLDPAAVAGMQRPVLIRQFENEVNVSRAAILSNEGGGLKMSALEQAKVDAERMPALQGLDVPENGDLGAPGARAFLRRWLQNMPLEQQSGLVAADGKLSAEGLLRARNAILFHAYGDSPTLARLIESADEAQKNVANALVKTAANVADARQAMELGDLHDRDIQPQILQAVEKFQEIRASDMSVDEFVNQGDMFGNGIGPEATALMRYFEANKRSAKAMAEAINGYYDAVRALGDPKQASMFEADAPSRAAILSTVLKSEIAEPKVALENGKYGGTIEAAKSLPDEQRAIEQRFAEWILADVDRAVDAYAAHPETDGGKIINTDIARDLSPDYNASKDSRSALSSAVHEPASWLVKELYRRKLAEEPKAGEQPRVMFTAGGTGAGKSTAIEGVPSALDKRNSSQIVYDTNMNTMSSAVSRIEQALEAGKKVDITYVARDPVVALTQGALPRAMRQGRTAPLPEHARTHAGSADVIQKLAEKYKDNPDVKVNVLDNTGPRGTVADADIATVKAIDYNNLEARLRAALESEFKNGRITEAVYRGTGGDAKAGGLAGGEKPAGGRAEGGDGRTVQQELPPVQRHSDGADGGRHEQQSAGAEENTVGQILESAPNAKLVDEAGDIRAAVPALAEADATIAKAESDAPGYDAAVACFLRG